MEFKKIGVIGAGVMGIGVSVDLILNNLDVILIDTLEEQLEKAKKEILETIRFAPMLKKGSPKLSQEEVLARIKFSTDLNEVSDVDFVVENITEDWELKKDLYSKLDKICEKDICFGVDTSCLSITQVASATERVDKVIGIHFMNPVYLKPTLEVMKGFHTSEETIALTKDFLSQIGKNAIVVNDFPGFVSNRISHLFMNEAAFVIQDDLAQPKDVDEIFKKCFGHTMGPLETADLIGLDTVANSLKVLYESYQDPKFRCCPLLKKMVDAKLLGRKTGRGFYNYN
ncbi:MAG: 3-hydroxybutyryl-CoA dehydrogenase [Bacteroidales bacterium]|nr:3-hydroxybutyryl-CoA dehydrogenase [Bacteroidales bacterium]